MDVVLASGNPGKLSEFAELLGGLPLRIRLQSEFDIVPPAETGTTFVENAIIKARHASAASGLPAMADDSGLCVDALAGAPGVRSARYAGEDASDAENVARLLAATATASDRRCSFVCVIACLRHAEDPLPVIASGRWGGELLPAPRGEHGFGYDPVFLVPQTGTSAAELAPAEKNRRSHRAQAVAALREPLEAAWQLR